MKQTHISKDSQKNTPPIRVLWLIKGLSAGGAEKLLSMSIPYLNYEKYKYQVAYIFKNKADLVPEFEQAGIPVHCLDMKGLFDVSVLFKLVRLLRKEHIDILHMHLPFAAIIGRVAAILAGVKIRISSEHDLVRRYHPVTRMGSILTYPLNTATIAVSGAVARSIKKSKMVRSRSIHVVHNGIDLQNIDRLETEPKKIRQSLGISDDHLIVGNVAHIRPKHKGHQYLIEAAKIVTNRMSKVSFVIVGREQHQGDQLTLEKQAQQLGIRNNVVFTGFRQDALSLITAFDVFVLPSIWEAFGIVLLEAMALGKPIIASRVDGIPEVIEDGKNGFLVEPRNPQQLAEKIIKLLQNQELREQLGQSGIRRVRDNFDIKQKVTQTERIYSLALERKR